MNLPLQLTSAVILDRFGDYDDPTLKLNNRSADANPLCKRAASSLPKPARGEPQ
jgi:hypothetical protein